MRAQATAVGGLLCIVSTAATAGARPWRYEEHTGPALAAPCATSAGKVSCPAPATGCCVAPYSPANKTGCLVPAIATPSGKGCTPPCHHPGTTCCTPGAPLPLSTTLKNVLIFGDSVSIDYTPYTKKNLSDVALVQHAPWDVSDGGAGSTSFMVNCLDVFMRHADGSAIKWDLIFFNSGLHNMNNSTGGLAAYKTQLAQIVAGLQKLQPHAKLVWAVTTPYMPDKTTGNFAVEQQNAIAAKIMTAQHIPSVDLCESSLIRSLNGRSVCAIVLFRAWRKLGCGLSPTRLISLSLPQSRIQQ